MVARKWGEEYPMYHCRICGRFFKDAEGMEPDSIRGQQLSLTDITCASCQREKRQEEGNEAC